MKFRFLFVGGGGCGVAYPAALLGTLRYQAPRDLQKRGTDTLAVGQWINLSSSCSLSHFLKQFADNAYHTHEIETTVHRSTADTPRLWEASMPAIDPINGYQ